MTPGDPTSDPKADAERRVGKPLTSKWTLEGLLGLGGMAAVYAARHKSGKRAAVKILHADLAQDAEVRERFLREGKIANRVQHAGRVAVDDDDVSDDGEPFMVMELLEGETLHDMRRRLGGKISVEEALRIFDPVLDFLEACHQVGVIHRDVKPANIFITKAGKVKVLDFGVARLREEQPKAASGPAQKPHQMTMAGTTLGTAAYIPPEQAMGLVDQVDGRSDVFSAGACMFVALSGERLNQGRSEVESFVLAATKPAPSLATVAPALPPSVIALVDKAIAYKRDARYPDAKSMRDAIVRVREALARGDTSASVASAGVAPAPVPAPAAPPAAEASVRQSTLTSQRFDPAAVTARPPPARDEPVVVVEAPPPAKPFLASVQRGSRPIIPRNDSLPPSSTVEDVGAPLARAPASGAKPRSGEQPSSQPSSQPRVPAATPASFEPGATMQVNPSDVDAALRHAAEKKSSVSEKEPDDVGATVQLSGPDSQRALEAALAALKAKSGKG